MHTTPAPRSRCLGWAVTAAIGCLLVAGYFYVAAALDRVTLFGTEVSSYQLARSHEALAAAGWALLAAPIAALGALTTGRWLVQGAIDRDRRPPTAAGLLFGWMLAFMAAMLSTRMLPSAVVPLGFGIVWGVGGAVVAPAGVALLATITWRQPAPLPPPPVVDRSSTPWWSGE